MSPANSRIQSLKEMLALEEKRAVLLGQLNSIDQRMSALKDSVFSGISVTTAASPTGKTRGRPPGSTNASKDGARGTHREYIMAALGSAGAAGVRVKDLAIAMKTKPVNIHSWFHSNLKRIPTIQKIAGGHYRLKAGSTAAGPAAKAAPKPAAAKAGKPGKGGKGGRRGALSERILEHLKTAGPGGIKIADVADQLGAKYKNIYMWFSTTGKKHGIKKVAPATYRLP